MEENSCPECDADWTGEPIPEEVQDLFGGKTHFSRLIGIEVTGKYDGVSYWMCPHCRVMWDRWTGEKLQRNQDGKVD